jgi:hypothetical protein
MRPIDADALVESLSASYKELRVLSDSLNEGDVAKEIYQGELITFLESILRTKEAPTLDYAPVRHGEWIKDDTPFAKQRKCSVCGKCDNPKTAIRGHYCWFCGAKMDGGKNDV